MQLAKLNRGWKEVFTPDEELELKNCIVMLSRFGFAPTLSDIREIVSDYVNINEKEKAQKTPRLRNTGLVSSGDSLTSWGEGASLALVGNPSSDGITIKMPYEVDVLHRPASHPIFSNWVG